MKRRQKHSDDVVPFDERTMIWLAHLEQVTGTPMAELVASLVRAIMLDDERAHKTVLH